MGDDETFEVDTANLAFSLLRPGTYRLDVSPDGTTTTVTTRGGEGEVTGGGQAFPVHAHQSARVSGSGSLAYDMADDSARDGFDNWADGRDRREDRSQSARYVSRDMIGYEDLDEYGTWRADPTYRPGLAPRVVVCALAPHHHRHL